MIGLWRGRVGPPTPEAQEEVRLARLELERMWQVERFGSVALPDFIDLECDASFRLAMAEYDAASDQWARWQGLRRHVERMQYRALQTRSIGFFHIDPIPIFRQVDRHATTADLLQRLQEKGGE